MPLGTQLFDTFAAISALAAKQNLAVQVSLEKLNFLLNKRAEKINKCLNPLYAQNLFGLKDVKAEIAATFAYAIIATDASHFMPKGILQKKYSDLK